MTTPEKFDLDLLEATDLVAGPATLTIAEIIPPNTVKDRQGRPVDKPMIRFEERDKEMVVSKTNERCIKAALNEAKASKWVGKKITIMRRFIDCSLPNTGNDTDCIRVVCDPVPVKARPYYGTERPKHSKH